jgi:hypothetical protein
VKTVDSQVRQFGAFPSRPDTVVAELTNKPSADAKLSASIIDTKDLDEPYALRILKLKS